ncbi:hypothetical protein CU098_012532 [Rhizopus stolonifer]|uniref:Uncharacterized protein n=1 Tax=Rhizopus stolonifer TaxID=4846 RepID=A0A367KSR9_RHIST|nr:hypothetical protein CU098_012532 [Rhizopus stolonifer]
MEYHSEHPYSASCAYCKHHNELLNPFYNEIDKQQEEDVYRYNYLLNLMTAPDMSAYLSIVHDEDSMCTLPIHLQCLISEAKEEIVLSTDKRAQLRLERLRRHLWQRSGGDLSILMMILKEIVTDEDELEDLLRQD